MLNSIKKTKRILLSKNHLLYAILDARQLDGQNLLEVSKAWIKGGIHILQFRAKKNTACLAKKYLPEIQKLCKKNNVPLIMNDSLDLAIQYQTDGIHLGQKDLSPTMARKALGNDAWIGLSTHTLRQAAKAQQEPIDYIGFGPIFPTKTKHDIQALTGTSKLASLSKSLPFFAIGGITEENLPSVMQQGCYRCAAAGSLMKNKNFFRNAKQWIKILSGEKLKKII